MAADWFAAFWPVALIVLAIAAVGVAIYLMRDKFVEVFAWIRAHWALLVDIIFGPFGIAITMIIQHWGDLMAFFKGLPGDIARIFGDVWGGIEDAFRAVINSVIDIWNQLHFTLPKVDVLGVHIGGETIGVPSIPHLAQGGLITQTGIVYAHAGEVISPAPAGAGGGPLVAVNGAPFNSATDIDMLCKKIEFAIETRQRLSA